MDLALPAKNRIAFPPPGVAKTPYPHLYLCTGKPRPSVATVLQRSFKMRPAVKTCDATTSK